MVVNEIYGNVLMRMLSVTYNTHTSRIIYSIDRLGQKRKWRKEETLATCNTTRVCSISTKWGERPYFVLMDDPSLSVSSPSLHPSHTFNIV